MLIDRKLSKRFRLATGGGIKAFFFLILAGVALIPFLWGVITSLKPTNIIFAFPPKIFLFKPAIEHYKRVIESGIAQSFLVSLFNSGMSIVICVTLALLAGYSFDRFRFPLRRFFFLFVIIGVPLAIGSFALLLPSYLYFSKIGMLNNRFTLIVIYTAYQLPMSIWIMKGIFESIPKEIDESAMIDGCSSLYTLFRILLPLAKPAVGSIALLVFIRSWNDFIIASVMVDKIYLRPIQVSIYNYMGYFYLH